MKNILRRIIVKLRRRRKCTKEEFSTKLLRCIQKEGVQGEKYISLIQLWERSVPRRKDSTDYAYHINEWIVMRSMIFETVGQSSVYSREFILAWRTLSMLELTKIIEKGNSDDISALLERENFLQKFMRYHNDTKYVLLRRILHRNPQHHYSLKAKATLFEIIVHMGLISHDL